MRRHEATNARFHEDAPCSFEIQALVPLKGSIFGIIGIAGAAVFIGFFMTGGGLVPEEEKKDDLPGMKAGETDHIRLADPSPSPEAAAVNERYLESLRQQNAASVARRPQPVRPVTSNSGGGARLHHISQYKDPNACEAAKAERARVYETVGLHRSFELSRRMDDKVWSACK